MSNRLSTSLLVLAASMAGVPAVQAQTYQQPPIDLTAQPRSSDPIGAAPPPPPPIPPSDDGAR